jgi:flagellar basal-body rod protein FlgG
MLRGLYTSALGMTTQMQRMDVVSNNIANVNTTGFKRDGVAAHSFSCRMGHRIDDPVANGILRLMGNTRPIGRMSPGVFIDEVFTDFATGGFRETGNPLDMALAGSGFFAVTVTNYDGTTQEKFTRDGNFTISADGILMDMAGARLQSVGGATGGTEGNNDITLPSGNIVIGSDGRIFVNDEYIATVRIVDIANPTSLRKSRGSYWAVTEETEITDFHGTVAQGFLENSNVQAVREMVELVALHRAYEANSRMVQIHDETLGRAVNEIARR